VTFFEIVCVCVVGLTMVVRLQHREAGDRALGRWLGVALLAFATEASCIRLYGFYFYDPYRWHTYVVYLPIVVAAIWPMVIDSAYALSRGVLGKDDRRAPLLGAAVVFADACLIEAIAVNSGLWAWTEPGFFGVPPIGVVGWAVFAGGIMAVWSLADRSRWSVGREIGATLLVPLATHAVLLAAWWGALRWVSAPLPDWAVAGVAALNGAVVTLEILRRRSALDIPPHVMLLRIPAALVFAWLLLFDVGAYAPLWIFAAAFAAPYIALTPWKRIGAVAR